MSTLKTNNIQHVDRSDPSIIISTDGGVSIAGTLTYEDVTSVDAVGIVTAREIINAQKQVHVGTGVSVKAGGINVTAGITTVQAFQATTGTFSAAVSGTTGTFSGAVSGTTGTFSGDVDIADKIIHTGDTDTAIRFPSANTVTVEAAGVQKLSLSTNEVVFNDTGIDCDFRVEGDNNANALKLDAGSDRVAIGLASPGAPLHVYHAAVNGVATFESGDTIALVNFKDNSTGSAYPSIGAVGDDLKLLTGDAYRATIKSTGNFGIGTENPGLPLHVYHATSNGAILAESGDSNCGISLKDPDGEVSVRAIGNNLTLTTSSSETERVRIDSSGRVLVSDSNAITGGFGTHTWDPKTQILETQGAAIVRVQNGDTWGGSLHLASANGTYASPTATASGDISGAIYFHANDGTDFKNYVAGIEAIVADTVASNDTPGYLKFSTTANGANSLTERLRIDMNGKFCFGTYNSGYVNNDSVANFINAASAGTENPLLTLWNPTTAADSRASIDFLTNAQSGTDRDGAFIRASNDGVTAKANLIFGTIKDETYDETMRLTSGGALLIGSTTQGSDELFKIFTDSTGPEMIQLRNNSSGTKDMITMMNVNNSGATMIRFKQTGGLSNVGSITTSASATAFNTSSDYRLKENEVLISDGITRLKTLKPYRFNFKTEPSKTVDGFFAHEVTPVVPEAVTGEKDAVETTYYTNDDTIPDGKAVGDIKEENVVLPQSLDYAKFTPLLTAALQEEVAKREALEVRIAAIEKIAGI